MKGESILQPLSRKEVTKMKQAFCKENKIPQRYYRQRNTFIVDFQALEKYSLNYYKQTGQKDLAKLKEKAFVNPKVLEQLFFAELTQYIHNKLSKRENRVFELLIYSGLKQKTIAKQLHISPRTVRRYLVKIRQIARKFKK